MTTDLRGAVKEPQQERSQATRLRILDAAVDCLLEEGYANLRMAKVAERAGVSRGAQLHHFPSKAMLVIEAVDHLNSRQDRLVTAKARSIGTGPDRVGRVLDVFWESYTGKLFVAELELGLAAAHDHDLAGPVTEVQLAQDRGMVEWCASLFGAPVSEHPLFRNRLQMAVGTMRGLAVLLSLGYSRRTVDRQWEFARERLVELMEDGTGAR